MRLEAELHCTITTDTEPTTLQKKCYSCCLTKLVRAIQFIITTALLQWQIISLCTDNVIGVESHHLVATGYHAWTEQQRHMTHTRLESITCQMNMVIITSEESVEGGGKGRGRGGGKKGGRGNPLYGCACTPSGGGVHVFTLGTNISCYLVTKLKWPRPYRILKSMATQQVTFFV